MDSSAAAANASVRPPLRRWILRAFFAGWTVLVVLVLWWLFQRKSTDSPLVINPHASASQPWSLRLQGWFELLRLNFYWAWGWLLLAPYVFALGWRFHLEKGRQFARVPVLLLGGIVFVWVSQALEKRAVANPDMVVVTGSNTTIEQTMNESGEVARVVIMPLGMTSKTNFLDPGQTQPKTSVTFSGALPPEMEKMLGSNFLAGGSLSNRLAGLIATNLMPDLTSTIENTMRNDILPRLDAQNRLPLSAGLDIFAYLGLLGLAHAGQLQRRYREREQQASALSAQLDQARLRALQAQLQPHFLFNALNGIATLVRRDPSAAHEMLISLSELLRLALNQSGQQQIALREEMEFLDHYIEIQQMRFGDRLRVEKQIEPAALDCFVPALLLQPLVENAIRHGIEPSSKAGLVRLQAGISAGTLLLLVEDDGVGLPAEDAGGARAIKSGVGLASVRERLETLYPGHHEFQVQARPGGGVVVRISLPARPATSLGPPPEPHRA